MRIKTKTLTEYAMLTALALVLGWVERMTFMPGIPGLRLGLGNIILLYALYAMGKGGMAMLMFLKVGLSAFFFGASGFTMLVSLGGGVCSVAIMILLKKFPFFNIIAVSIGGAVFHIMGQLMVIVLAAAAPIQFIILYLPILAAAAVGTGVLTGIVAKYTLRAMKKYIEGKEKK